MNTTKTAKWLIVLNTGMAIAFLMWAVAVYTQRIDWFTPAEAGANKEVVGQIEKMQEQYKGLGEANNKAYSLWVINQSQVSDQEATRPLRRDFYRDQIEMVRTGKYKGQPVALPFQKFVEDPSTGLMKIDQPTGRPAIAYKGNEPLQSLATYAALIASTTEQIKKVKEDISKLIADLKIENDKIYDADGNGLRKLNKEQEDILNAARLEREYLGTSYANSLADTTLFSKRLEAMKARLMELSQLSRKSD
ncbi:hypothetical protein KIH39_19775 [Telmatocola sphagniphila]|jgi:hypothetical protein|uniref:Uncharacterized protein n=1 Tax=Telmatocola sphagniphila TaxID=1123043 RepID=A0A8E6B499_9BACT|nr:hypothetical protein [Telmatocola sphagniphila]QVL31067.1 hypothetical protein KIH39_19775 [Telmatocola sphagniphila]